MDSSHLPLDDRKKPTEVEEAEKIIEQERGKIVTIVRGASSAALRDQLRLRSFRNILVVTIIGLIVLAIGLAIFGRFYPTRVPLCFQPSLDSGGSVVVCPTAYSTPLPPGQQPGRTLNLRIAEAAKPWDHLTVELIGLIAAAVVATEVERPAFASSLRWLGVECEAGLAEECLDEGGPVLDALEPVLHDRGELVHVADGEVAQAGLHGRPGPLGRIQLGRVSGQPHLGQPARMSLDEGAHHRADVGVQPVPDKMTGAFSSWCAAVIRVA